MSDKVCVDGGLVVVVFPRATMGEADMVATVMAEKRNVANFIVERAQTISAIQEEDAQRYDI